jgi:4-coumarate--CoA ligase
MPLKSRWTLDIPQCSLPTFFFKSPTAPLSDTKRCYLDADHPDTLYFTRADFRLWCQRFGLGLQRSKHFKKGDRILLFSGNNIFFPVVFLGTLCGGGIFTGANPSYVSRELAYQLKDSGATYLFCADASLDTGIEAARMVGMSLDKVFVFNHNNFGSTTRIPPQKGCQHWSALLASAEDAASFAWDDLRGDASNTTLALNYSSGTTGVPKGVDISHRNYIANTVQLIHQVELHPEYEIKNARAKWLCFLPMYHAMAQAIFLACAFTRGVPVWIMPKFDFLKVLEYIQKYRITDFTMVPPIAVALSKSPLVKNYDLSSVESIVSGAAPLSREVCAQVEQLWPDKGLNMKQGWGMTE